ncbi:DNA-binding protein [Chitinispirillales bacterium ANBcel5]|uniref:PPC domain-containing DNA-binding protein n=1 Tax=Cellulosispirillum alkaliphilum TaxID=3039283 RepID=UPI002A51142C|nr:DNA-binding protein [Chitinispirillales bacterium ANBcel5]
MEYTTGTIGRCIVMRLEEDDAVYECIETVARKEDIECGAILVIGGVKNGGVVVGPSDQNQRPLKPIVKKFSNAHEIAGIGTLFRNEANEPVLHMHASLGKEDSPIVGCPREGLDCWLVNEIILLEIKGIDAKRVKEQSGLELLKLFG